MLSREKFENNRELLINLLDDTIIDMINIIENLEILNNNIDLLQNMINYFKIVEVYKILDYRDFYKKLKKRITSNKNNYNKIVRIYGNIISFFTEKDYTEINNKIDEIYNNINITNNLIYPIKIKFHELIKYKKSNDDYLKININHPSIEYLLLQLYSNLRNIRNIRIELENLKRQKEIIMLEYKDI